jgi:hypothetical protein
MCAACRPRRIARPLSRWWPPRRCSPMNCRSPFSAGNCSMRVLIVTGGGLGRLWSRLGSSRAGRFTTMRSWNSDVPRPCGRGTRLRPQLHLIGPYRPLSLLSSVNFVSSFHCFAIKHFFFCQPCNMHRDSAPPCNAKSRPVEMSFVHGGKRSQRNSVSVAAYQKCEPHRQRRERETRGCQKGRENWRAKTAAPTPSWKFPTAKADSSRHVVTPHARV